MGQPEALLNPKPLLFKEGHPPPIPDGAWYTVGSSLVLKPHGLILGADKVVSGRN